MKTSFPFLYLIVLVRAFAAPVHLVDEAPLAISTIAPGITLVDFGRVAFGNVRLVVPSGATGRITVHFGESLTQGRIDRKPPGTVRYSYAELILAGQNSLVVAPPADRRNTEPQTANHPPAILTPVDWGVITPFRWVEIEGWPGVLRPGDVVRQAAYSETWNDDAARFTSSDEMLNRIWELCRYSIKATTFAGVYVDGDRERIPYEADTYLNQLSHYATDQDIQMARDTFDHLLQHPTWPTEWSFHFIFIAHADWMQTGDVAWLAPRYEALKSKLLLDRVRSDGLLVSNAAQIKHDDIVDWPQTERDGYEFKAVNTVVNAFHLRALVLMAELARALHRDAEAEDFLARERTAQAAFQLKLFDVTRGAYRDGEGSNHAALHASLFPLAFGLVPPSEQKRVTAFVVSRGMACSVYAAQYLLEGLFAHGAASEAIALIKAPGDRSWRHLLESGTTITWEAWDQHYKPNQDWNHAWGAAPANIFPRFVLGAQPLVPGWTKALIRPNPGQLSSAAGKIPTPRGPILIDWQTLPTFRITLTLPAGISARLELPAAAEAQGVYRNDVRLPAERIGDRWCFETDVSGPQTIQIK